MQLVLIFALLLASQNIFIINDPIITEILTRVHETIIKTTKPLTEFAGDGIVTTLNSILLYQNIETMGS